MQQGPGNEQNGTVGSDQLSYTIMDLEFASYSVRVAGFTAVGIGNSTVMLTKTPNEDKFADACCCFETTILQ